MPRLTSSPLILVFPSTRNFLVSLRNFSLACEFLLVGDSFSHCYCPNRIWVPEEQGCFLSFSLLYPCNSNGDWLTHREYKINIWIDCEPMKLRSVWNFAVNWLWTSEPMKLRCSWDTSLNTSVWLTGSYLISLSFCPSTCKTEIIIPPLS